MKSPESIKIWNPCSVSSSCPFARENVKPFDEVFTNHWTSPLDRFWRLHIVLWEGFNPGCSWLALLSFLQKSQDPAEGFPPATSLTLISTSLPSLQICGIRFVFSFLCCRHQLNQPIPCFSKNSKMSVSMKVLNRSVDWRRPPQAKWEESQLRFWLLFPCSSLARSDRCPRVTSQELSLSPASPAFQLF